MAELVARCGVVRGLNPCATTVVGIATEQYVPDQGYSLDAALFDKEIWTPEDQALMESIQKEFGYFTKPIRSEWNEDEYPGSWPE
jgi:hypothetical protein